MSLEIQCGSRNSLKISREIGPQNSIEYHSADSSAEALEESLYKFFEAQTNTGLPQGKDCMLHAEKNAERYAAAPYPSLRRPLCGSNAVNSTGHC
jgi:hypothetical protein